MRLLLVHGRSQGGKDEGELKESWLAALDEGLKASGLRLPEDVHVDFPFYGDVLDAEVARMAEPHLSGTGAMGINETNEYKRFLSAALAEIRVVEQIDDDAIRAEMPDDAVGEMGPANWEWLQAIVKVIDNKFTGVSTFAIEVLLRDVFLYLTTRRMQRKIDKIVSDLLTNEPTVVVGHSLGTVVAYNLLKRREPSLLRGYMTLGSPLGIKAISSQLGLPQHVSPTRLWYNAYDERDIVALNPLDERHFPVAPAIHNNNNLSNKTGNRHGIVGYLDNPIVAKTLVEMLQS